jgi:cytochrome b561
MAPAEVGRGTQVAGEREPGGAPRAGRAVLAALAACVLLALVAAGSLRGPLGAGGGRPRFPLELVETLGLLLVLAALITGVLALVVLLPDQRLRTPRARRGGVLTLLLPLLFVLGAWLFSGPLHWFGLRQPAPTSSPAPAPPSSIEVPAISTRHAWVPLVVVAVVVAGAAAAVVVQAVAERRRLEQGRVRRARLAELVDDTLDDVLAEADPRRAVIAAWARMERGLAATGLPRRAAETPFEYVARVLAEASVGPAAVHRLTDLFERAKFSRHPVDRAMRDDAVEALLAVRQELQEATTG